MRILLLLAFIVSCSTSTVSPKKAPLEDRRVEPVYVLKVESEVFTANSGLDWVKKLSEAANCTVNKEMFYQKVSGILSFDYSDHNGAQVYKNLMKHGCVIRTYKTKNPWSKVIATTYTSNKSDLYLNTRRNPRPMASMINTAVHECLHNAGYSHGNNSSAGKEGSVNYKLGKIAEDESEGCY